MLLSTSLLALTPIGVNFEIYPVPDGYTNLQWYMRDFQSDLAGAEKNIPTGDWQVTDINFELGTAYSGILYDQVVLSATLRRVPSRYLFRIILPITLITFASFVVFFMRNDFPTRIETSSTMMLVRTYFCFNHF